MGSSFKSEEAGVDQSTGEDHKQSRTIRMINWLEGASLRRHVRCAGRKGDVTQDRGTSMRVNGQGRVLLKLKPRLPW